MSIKRAPRPQSHYTIIANDILRDRSLSFRARGILACILSRPDNWRTDAESLSRESKEGRTAILTALKELEVAGYLQRKKYQNEKGHWVSESLVFDKPQDPTYGNPTSGNPTSGNPTLLEEPYKKEIEEVNIYTSDSERLCELLADSILGNGFTRPTVTSGWHRDMERLLRIDKREVWQVEKAIVWVAQHDFWSLNIRSPHKLREHFERLRAEAQRTATKSEPRGFSAIREFLSTQVS